MQIELSVNDGKFACPDPKVVLSTSQSLKVESQVAILHWRWIQLGPDKRSFVDDQSSQNGWIIRFCIFLDAIIIFRDSPDGWTVEFLQTFEPKVNPEKSWIWNDLIRMVASNKHQFWKPNLKSFPTLLCSTTEVIFNQLTSKIHFNTANTGTLTITKNYKSSTNKLIKLLVT